jgi:cytochrome c-type biogenesis protein CcmH/NrfG
MTEKSRINLCAVVALNAAILPVGCNRSPQAQEAQYLKRGAALMAKKDYGRALLEFRNASRVMPKDAEPHYQLGLAFLASGNAPNGIRALRSATELNPKHAGAQLKLAELMTTSQNQDILRDAVGRLESVLTASPDNIEATDTLALAEWRLGKIDDASKRLEEALQRFPTSLRSSIQLARLKLSRNDLKGAEEVLRKAAVSAPKSPDAAVALGELYLLSNQPDRAEPEFRRALALEAKPVLPSWDWPQYRSPASTSTRRSRRCGKCRRFRKSSTNLSTRFSSIEPASEEGSKGIRGIGQSRSKGQGGANASGLCLFCDGQTAAGAESPGGSIEREPERYRRAAAGESTLSSFGQSGGG